jgi:hypothetical protein
MTRKVRVIRWLPGGGEHRFDVEPKLAAQAMGITTEELLRTLKEYDRCDVAEHTAWFPSERRGVEYPTAESGNE